MKEYSEYQLSELFSKIDNILQAYFGEEESICFYEKESENHKIDLTKRNYVMYLSNGDSFKIKIIKNSIPHLLGINTDYLKKTGLYKSTDNSYDVMLKFIRNYKGAYKNHREGIINLKEIISPYIEKKLDSIVKNLIITTTNCCMVCKYDSGKTYGYGKESDKMSHLILQRKDDKYYVLKLGSSNENDLYYPMSNQVYDTYEEFCEKFSIGLSNQEVTLLNGIKFSIGGYSYNNGFHIQPYERKPKLVELKKLAADLNCVPNVLHDYMYSLGVMDEKRNSNLEDSEVLLKLRDCITKKIPFDLAKEFVASAQLISLINVYNDSLFLESNADATKKFSDVTKENIALRQDLDNALKKLDKTNSEKEILTEQLLKNRKLYSDASTKLNKIKDIVK